MLIAVDFDGTCVKHEYPAIGAPVPGAIKWLKAFQEAGATLMLWTMRSTLTTDADTLTPAVKYLKAAGIEIEIVNENPDQRWTNSPKLFAHLLIDDVAFGCPLIRPKGQRPYVNWAVVGPQVLSELKKTKSAMDKDVDDA